MPDLEDSADFAELWNGIAIEATRIQSSKGFEVHRHVAIDIATIHSELSEALEAYRGGNPVSHKIPDFSAAEEELADAVIRIMIHGGARGYRLAEAIIAKIRFNSTRPCKHGGKRF